MKKIMKVRLRLRMLSSAGVMRDIVGKGASLWNLLIGFYVFFCEFVGILLCSLVFFLVVLSARVKVMISK